MKIFHLLVQITTSYKKAVIKNGQIYLEVMLTHPQLGGQSVQPR
ncbi:hypothetical protein CSC14_0986 [Proteus mirabilis]|nr:hypothetical protein CSC14_0986 [Proteus mirabilis]